MNTLARRGGEGRHSNKQQTEANNKEGTIRLVYEKSESSSNAMNQILKPHFFKNLMNSREFAIYQTIKGAMITKIVQSTCQ